MATKLGCATLVLNPALSVLPDV